VVNVSFLEMGFMGRWIILILVVTANSVPLSKNLFRLQGNEMKPSCVRKSMCHVCEPIFFLYCDIFPQSKNCEITTAVAK
jgi:hypothetical protein